MKEVNVRKGGNVCAGEAQGDTFLVRIWELEHGRGVMERCDLTDEQLGDAALGLRFHDLTSLDAMIGGLVMARTMFDRSGEDASEIHNRIAPQLAAKLISEAGDEVDAMIILESVIYGVLFYYRKDPLQAAEFLDTVTERVIDRMKPEPVG
jgi:hypothetical protein